MGNEIAKIGIEDEQLASRFQMEVGGDRVELYRRLAELTEWVNEQYLIRNDGKYVSVRGFLSQDQCSYRDQCSFSDQYSLSKSNFRSDPGNTYGHEDMRDLRFNGLEVRQVLEGDMRHTGTGLSALVESTLYTFMQTITPAKAGDTSGAGGPLGL